MPWPRNGAELLQLAGRLAALERLLPLEAVAADGGDELARQGVDDRRADAVQAAGVEIAVAVAELAAGVQRRQDQFQGRPSCAWGACRRGCRGRCR